MEPDFLSLGEVLEIHRDQIERYGGSMEIRSMDLLESALAMPPSGTGETYFHEDLYSMAAAYLFHIARNHPFVDGNKRTGTAAALVFLLMNGIEIDADEDTFHSVVEQAACGKLGKSEIADYFRKQGRPVQ